MSHISPSTVAEGQFLPSDEARDLARRTDSSDAENRLHESEIKDIFDELDNPAVEPPAQDLLTSKTLMPHHFKPDSLQSAEIGILPEAYAMAPYKTMRPKSNGQDIKGQRYYEFLRTRPYTWVVVSANIPNWATQFQNSPTWFTGATKDIEHPWATIDISYPIPNRDRSADPAKPPLNDFAIFSKDMDVLISAISATGSFRESEVVVNLHCYLHTLATETIEPGDGASTASSSESDIQDAGRPLYDLFHLGPVSRCKISIPHKALREHVLEVKGVQTVHQLETEVERRVKSLDSLHGWAEVTLANRAALGYAAKLSLLYCMNVSFIKMHESLWWDWNEPTDQSNQHISQNLIESIKLAFQRMEICEALDHLASEVATELTRRDPSKSSNTVEIVTEWEKFALDLQSKYLRVLNSLYIYTTRFSQDTNATVHRLFEQTYQEARQHRQADRYEQAAEPLAACARFSSLSIPRISLPIAQLILVELMSVLQGLNQDSKHRPVLVELLKYYRERILEQRARRSA